MCRNIKPLFNFEPPATDDEIRDAALQFVRKLSGTTKPSQRNQQAFDQAVDGDRGRSARAARFDGDDRSHPRNREEEAAKARARIGAPVCVSRDRQ